MATTVGSKLALGVGVAALGGAIAVIALGGERFSVIVLVLVGASALAGWQKARPPSGPSAPPS